MVARLEGHGGDSDETSVCSQSACQQSSLPFASTHSLCMSSCFLPAEIGMLTVSADVFAAQVVIGILNLIALFGLLICGQAADMFGRKKAIALASVLFICGALGMACAWNFVSLLVGRIVTGVAVGCGFLVPPVCLYLPLARFDFLFRIRLSTLRFQSFAIFLLIAGTDGKGCPSLHPL